MVQAQCTNLLASFSVFFLWHRPARAPGPVDLGVPVFPLSIPTQRAIPHDCGCFLPGAACVWFSAKCSHFPAAHLSEFLPLLFSIFILFSSVFCLNLAPGPFKNTFHSSTFQLPVLSLFCTFLPSSCCRSFLTYISGLLKLQPIIFC